MISPIQSSLPALPQGPQPDVLLRLVPFGVAVVSPAPLGGSDEGPSGGLVEGAGEARGLDEHGRDVVALGPIVGQLPAHEREDVRAQIGDRDPGQDEESRVTVRSSGDAIAGPAAIPGSTRPIGARLGGLLTAITR